MPETTTPARRTVLLLCLLAAFVAVAGPPESRFAPGAAIAAEGSLAEEATGLGLLVIETATGALPFRVELARTPAELAQGLQHRRQLPPDAGMLFDFGPERIVTMWMKNTHIPLDMLFIKADGTVGDIAQDTEPFSLETIASRVPVRAVLEVNAGTAERLGVRPGDRVRHPIFGEP
ncbi:MAG TPA: DUF192 domain-containing protein [Rhodospirillales bacterium]|nr:DUF192 domain-containing protein [Rhodospirillales bacterium]